MIACLTLKTANNSFIKIHQSFLIRSSASSVLQNISFLNSYFFIIEILFLFNLTSEFISTVYQFHKFVKSDNLLIKKIFQNCLNFFDFITSHYLKLSFSQESLQFNNSIK